MYLLLSAAGGKDKDMYFNQVEFGKRLQECRKLQKMTQEELTEQIGVEKQHISRIERGVSACSIDLLPMLSATLCVSTDYLLMGKSIDKEMTRTQLLSVISQLYWLHLMAAEGRHSSVTAYTTVRNYNRQLNSLASITLLAQGL